jgi:ATP-dependent DNA ligase
MLLSLTLLILGSLSLRLSPPCSDRILFYMRPLRFDTTQLSLVRIPFDDPDFLFELKQDGFRALAHIWDGNCELISRKRNAYKSFQALRDNLAKLKVENALIDGELVFLDTQGRSIFNELLFPRGCPIGCRSEGAV